MRTIEFTEAGVYCVQPDIGSIPDTTAVEVTWDDTWTGNENCLRLINGSVVFDINVNYARNRLEAYNALNQFELISDDSINGTTTHKDAILAIKAEFPKP